MPAKLKGLAKVKKTLASGKTIYYCYAWRGGPLLKNTKGEPLQPEDHDLQRAFKTVHDQRRNPAPKTLFDLITVYIGSSDFQTKAVRTKRHYADYLDLIRKEFGALSLLDLESIGTRGEFKRWRDSLADKPRSADYAWSVLSRVLSFAKDRGMLSRNIAERGGRVYRADRREAVWTDDDISAFNTNAGPELRLALLLAFWTGQRKGDLLALKWTAYDGVSFHIKQSKSGRRVTIPATNAVRVALKDATRRSPNILSNSRGKPWTDSGFSTSWRKAMAVANVKGLTFHDLRGTTVTRLAMAGCSIAEIGAVTGHSPRDIDAILHVHYLGGQRELAAQAMARLENLVS